jgi:hypothetical protein
LQIYFIFARFWEFPKVFKQIKTKELLEEGSKGVDVNEGIGLFKISMNCIVRFIIALKADRYAVA